MYMYAGISDMRLRTRSIDQRDTVEFSRRDPSISLDLVPSSGSIISFGMLSAQVPGRLTILQTLACTEDSTNNMLSALKLDMEVGLE